VAGLKLGRVLTVVLVVMTSAALVIIVLGQMELSSDEYQSNISYSLSRVALKYDYSCEENVYGLYLNLTNLGTKIVQNFQVSVTNELCVGSVPPLPSYLNPGQSLQFYLYTTSPNGTISVTGNNTNLFINF